MSALPGGGLPTTSAQGPAPGIGRARLATRVAQPVACGRRTRTAGAPGACRRSRPARWNPRVHPAGRAAPIPTARPAPRAPPARRRGFTDAGWGRHHVCLSQRRSARVACPADVTGAQQSDGRACPGPAHGADPRPCVRCDDGIVPALRGRSGRAAHIPFARRESCSMRTVNCKNNCLGACVGVMV